MAKQFKCLDLGIACQLAYQAETEDELLEKVLQHMLTVHGLDMSQPPMLDNLKAAITTHGEPSTTPG